MRWPNMRATYPNQWLVIEALEAHTEGNRRILDPITVVEVCPDSVTAMQTYRKLHQQYPLREFYFVHTSRASLDIEERQWVGIRRSDVGNTEALRRMKTQGFSAFRVLSGSVILMSP